MRPLNIFRTFLLRRQGGNITLLAALCFPMIIGAVGAGIDFYYAYNVKMELQNAADAAALAAARPSVPDSEREDLAARIFFAETGHYHLIGKIELTVETAEDGSIIVGAKAAVKNRFAQLVGFRKIDLDICAIASQSFEKSEIAFVLDVSGSMRRWMDGEPRLNVLKRSAKNMIDILERHASASNRPAYAIVPFNMNVNIGTAMSAYVTQIKHPLFAGTQWAGCVLERAGDNANSDKYSAPATDGTGKWHAYIWPPEPNSTPWCTNESNGTMTGYKRVVNNPPGVYTAQTQGPNYNCVRHAITPLNENPFLARTAIDKLTAEYNMGTIIAPGVSWGMRVLSNAEPFTEGSADASKVHKIMVVLTDGEQTTEASSGSRYGCDWTRNTVSKYEFDPADFGLAGDPIVKYGPEDEFSPYGYIRDSDPFNSRPRSWRDVADDLYNVSIEACDYAKSAAGSGVEIFTIAVSNDAGPGTRTYDLLKNCASDEAHFFYAADSLALGAAFTKIADEVVNVHLTK